MGKGADQARRGFTPTSDRIDAGFIARIVAVATIGGFMFGYDSGVINGTQEGLKQAFGLTSLGTGVTVGSILVGCAAGAFAAGRLADLVGRRQVMMIAALLFVLSAVASGAAGSTEIFVAARFVGGLGVGAASIISPIYISEVAPAHIRGRLASVQQVMIITGLTAAFLANYLLAEIAGKSTSILWLGYPAWRWMFWMQVAPAALYLFALFTIPESPRWLVMRTREEEARTILARLFGDASAGEKLAGIRRGLVTFEHQPRFSDLLDPATKRLRMIVKAGIGLAVFQQLSGIVVIFYYGAALWQSVGFDEADALRINILTGALSIVSCVVAITLIDRIGRRPLLLFGSVTMGAALAVMAFAFSRASVGLDGMLQLSQGLGLCALIAANVFAAVFNGTWGPVMWVMLGEMFPTQIRGSSLAVAGAAQWGANFAMTLSFPALAGGLGLTVTYGLYAALAFLSGIFVLKMVAETRGKELEDMPG